MLCNFKDCNIKAAAVTYLFFLCNFKGHFHLYLKLPICTKNVCNPKANPFGLKKGEKPPLNSRMSTQSSLFYSYDIQSFQEN